MGASFTAYNFSAAADLYFLYSVKAFAGGIEDIIQDVSPPKKKCTVFF